MFPWTTPLNRCARWLSGSRPKKSDRKKLAYSAYRDSTHGGVCAAVTGDVGPAVIRYLSVDGIGMVVSRPFEPGTRLIVTLMNQPGKVSRTLRVYVNYVLEHPSGDWILGGVFAGRLTGSELHALLTP
jgi:hypothetical protein